MLRNLLKHQIQHRNNGPERCPHTGPSQTRYTAFTMVRSRLTEAPASTRPCLGNRPAFGTTVSPASMARGPCRSLSKPYGSSCSHRLPGARESSPQAHRWWADFQGVGSRLHCVVLGPFLQLALRSWVHGAPNDLWPAPPSS